LNAILDGAPTAPKSQLEWVEHEGSFMNIFQKSIALLTRREQKRGMLVCVIVMCMALFEVVSVASIVPFLSILANPQMIQENAILASIYSYLGFSSTFSFLLFLGIAAFCLLLTAAAVRSLGYYALMTFTQMRRHSIGARLLQTYLRQPYEYYLNRHTSDLSKGILSEVDIVINSVFIPIANMLAYGFTLIAIVALLILVDPLVAIFSGVILTGVYGLIFVGVRSYLSRIGVLRANANTERFEATTEALAGIKDIKLLGREHAYLTRFTGPSRQVAHLMAVSSVLSHVPKYIVEAVAFGGILLLSILLMLRHGGHDAEALRRVLPLLGLYAFAGYRMIPAVHAIYACSANLRFGAAALDGLYADLCDNDDLPQLQLTTAPALPITRKIELNALSYSYPNSEGVGVCDVSVTIPGATFVCIGGRPGAQNTTLVDLVLGLLSPSSGEIRIDGKVVTDKNRRNWQANIGYVPQDIFLVDASLLANIALGIAKDDIDHARVRECARQAQIDRFIEDELPLGYETEVGERGVRLSGGQRQRIGIARALYHDPAVIVFDEATSALDNLTEQDVMHAIGAFHGQKTLFMIAHRMSTVKACDQIIVLEKGRVVGCDNWQTLIESNSAFQRIAKVVQSA
jgi:ABC-type multidrug transport system fused ATPase/permease subunit